jgi:hypothetical protein
MTTMIKATRVDNDQLAQFFADKIGIPVDEWYGKCHVISLAIVRLGILQGPAGARIRVARGFHPSVPGRQHSWISLGDPYDPETEYLDPTLWCWTGDHPEIWSGAAGDSDHFPHGTGDIWEYGCPVHAGGPTITLTPEQPLSADARLFLDIVGPLDVRGWMAMANAPVGGEWPAGEIFAAISQTEGIKSFVPIDVLGMTTDLNPGELYW